MLPHKIETDEAEQKQLNRSGSGVEKVFRDCVEIFDVVDGV
jgi:hypothetical protein